MSSPEHSGEIVYLDYGATTPIDKRVLELMLSLLEKRFANPSSLYQIGRESRDLLEASRKTVAACIGARDPHEIAFTSGGTESDNMAVLGIAAARAQKMPASKGPGHIICSSFEHMAVLEAVRHTKSLGYQITTLNPGPDGFIDPAELASAIRPDTLLVSVMLTNNEIGTIQPIKQIADVCHDRGVPLHADAVAALGKTPINVQDLSLDALSIASHKIYGPKGIGALWISKKIPFVPLIHGGGQEHGRRSGTQDVPSIAGFAKACELACGSDQADEIQRLAGLRDRLIQEAVKLNFSSGSPHCAVDIPSGNTMQHLCSLVPLIVPGLESAELVRRLDSLGICVSGGSACGSTKQSDSHVLESIGLTSKKLFAFCRITMGRFTTDADVDRFLNALHKTVNSCWEKI